MNQLRELRRRQDLSQQGLAVKAHVSPSLLVMIERWSYVPTLIVQERIATALGCKPQDIWPRDQAQTISTADR